MLWNLSTNEEVYKMNFKLASIKASAILIPTYAVAFYTEKMVYTIPMLAAATVFVTALNFEEIFSKKNDLNLSGESTKMEGKTDMTASKEVDIEGE